LRRFFGSRSGELFDQSFRGSGTRFGDNLILGVEVPIEAAVREARGRHQIGKTRPSDSILTECRRRRLDDALLSERRFLFRFPHAVSVLSNRTDVLDSLDDS